MEKIETTEKKLIRMLGSLVDFRHADSAVTFLLQDVDWQREYKISELRRFKCYETTAIVAFCRPFVPARNKTALGVKQVGVTLTEQERALKNHLMTLRNKIIAHSDEELMHFRLDLIEFDETDIRIPVLKGDEGLLLTEKDVMALDALIRKFVAGISEITFDVAQSHPELIEMYKRPT